MEQNGQGQPGQQQQRHLGRDIHVDRSGPEDTRHLQAENECQATAQYGYRPEK
jgi:hypothetical protein